MACGEFLSSKFLHKFLLSFSSFLPPSKKHVSRCIGYAKLPMVVNECVIVHVLSALP